MVFGVLNFFRTFKKFFWSFAGIKFKFFEVSNALQNKSNIKSSTCSVYYILVVNFTV